MNAPHFASLLRRVRRRIGWQCLGRAAYRALLLAAGGAVLVVVGGRGFSLYSDAAMLAGLGALAAIAVAAAVALRRRPGVDEAARLADRAAGTHDLFLTAVMLDKAPGAYQPLVAQRAEAAARGVEPARVVPLAWQEGSSHVVAAWGAVLLAFWLAPQFDPFGGEEVARRVAERRDRLEETRAVTVERATALAATPLDAEHSPAVDQALKQVVESFRKMEPAKPQGNLERILAQQQQISQMWRQAQEKALDQPNSNRAMQRFGAGEQDVARQAREALKQGDAKPIQRELAQLQALAEKLAQEPDAKKAAALRRELTEALSKMAQSGASGATSAQMQAALARALEQLDLSATSALSGESLEALAQSLELAKMEASQIAQTARDLAAMEEAMRALQMARQANEQSPLSGQQPAQSLAEYAKLYEQMTSQTAGMCKGGANCPGGAACPGGGQCPAGGGSGGAVGAGGSMSGQTALGGAQGQGAGQGSGSGAGGGMGGPGQGQGGLASEDRSGTQAFRTEKANSALQAGRILMQWKTQEEAEAGEMAIDYRGALETVRQSADEAILHEQIPPGYRDSIQSYFDDLAQAAAAAEQ